MLTDLKIKAAKPIKKDFKLTDANGLYLLVKSTGSKLWRYDYRFTGKRKTIALGEYPVVTLSDARSKHLEARKLLDRDIDPSEAKKMAKAARYEALSNSFDSVAREWVQVAKVGKADSYEQNVLRRLELHFLPWLGKKPIAEITPMDILTCVKRMIDGNKNVETAHKVLGTCSLVFKYAKQHGLILHNPASDLSSAIPQPQVKHFASIIEPSEVGAFMRAIDAFKGVFSVTQALKIAPLLFARIGELRNMRWSEIDLDAGTWKYFVSKTKTDHLVPLSRQSIAILREIEPVTGHHEYVFVGRDPQKCISEATINAAITRMGYCTKTQITGHGFRSMARTLLAERLGIEPQIIEHQLAHSVPDTLGMAYNRTKFIEQRTKMMQLWADYLDELKAGAKIIPFQQVS